jgi:hypothetical protein
VSIFHAHSFPPLWSANLPHPRQDLISCEELEAALTRLKETSGEAKVRSLVSVLDADHDGNINIREVAEVIESLAQEDTDIQPQHIALIKHLIEREGLQEQQQSNRDSSANSVAQSHMQ